MLFVLVATVGSLIGVVPTAGAVADCSVGLCVDSDSVYFYCDVGDDYVIFGTVKRGATIVGEGYCVFERNSDWTRGTFREAGTWHDDAECDAPGNFYLAADGFAGSGGKDLVRLASPLDWETCGSDGVNTYYIKGYFSADAKWGYWGNKGDDRLFLSSETYVNANDFCAEPSADESYDGNGSAAGEDGYDLVCGSVYSDYLYGGPLSDKLLGFGEVDHLYGGTGSDRLEGGLGGDWMQGDDGGDTMLGGDGNDTMIGDDGRESPPAACLDGAGDGVDYIYGEANTDSMYGCGGNDVMKGGTGVDYLYGGANSDDIYGNNVGTGDLECDQLYGGDGPVGDDSDYCYCGSAWNDGTNLGECEDAIGCGGC
jgi:Ca2+-binding RTX toxin-like protein